MLGNDGLLSSKVVVPPPSYWWSFLTSISPLL
jgi:hypothetical protein